MAARMRLTVGATTIDFSPREGMNRPEARSREVNKVHGSRLHISEFGNQERYELPVINMASTDADNINTWWQNMNVITFTPDLQGAPSSSLQVMIDNQDRPMQMWSGPGIFDDKYIGNLELHQTSSSSFSSSSCFSSESLSSGSDSASNSSVSNSASLALISCSLSSGNDSASLSSGSDSASESSVAPSSSCSVSSEQSSCSASICSGSASNSAVSASASTSSVSNSASCEYSASLSSGSDSSSNSSVSNSASMSACHS